MCPTRRGFELSSGGDDGIDNSMRDNSDTIFMTETLKGAKWFLLIYSERGTGVGVLIVIWDLLLGYQDRKIDEHCAIQE